MLLPVALLVEAILMVDAALDFFAPLAFAVLETFFAEFRGGEDFKPFRALVVLLVTLVVVVGGLVFCLAVIRDDDRVTGGVVLCPLQMITCRFVGAFLGPVVLVLGTEVAKLEPAPTLELFRPGFTLFEATGCELAAFGTSWSAELDLVSLSLGFTFVSLSAELTFVSLLVFEFHLLSVSLEVDFVTPTLEVCGW